MIRKNLYDSPLPFSPCPLFCSLFKRLITSASKHRSKISTSCLLLFFNQVSFPERDAKGDTHKKSFFITYLSRIRCYSDWRGLEDLADADVLNVFSDLLVVKLLLIRGVAGRGISGMRLGTWQNGVRLSSNSSAFHQGDTPSSVLPPGVCLVRAPVIRVPQLHEGSTEPSHVMPDMKH